MAELDGKNVCLSQQATDIFLPSMKFKKKQKNKLNGSEQTNSSKESTAQLTKNTSRAKPCTAITDARSLLSLSLCNSFVTPARLPPPHPPPTKHRIFFHTFFSLYREDLFSSSSLDCRGFSFFPNLNENYSFEFH